MMSMLPKGPKGGCVLFTLALMASPTSAQPSISTLDSALDTLRMSGFYELVAWANGGELRANAEELLHGGPVSRLSWRPGALTEKATHDPALRTALIDLLERENAIVDNPAPASLSQAQMIDYRLDLVAVVAAMNEPSTIPILAPWVSNGGTAATALVAFGSAALPHLILLLEDSDRYRQAGAAVVLGRMAERPGELGLSGAAMENIEGSLLRAVQNEDDFLARLAALRSLRAFSGEDVRSVMERIAKDERDSAVRDEARRWISLHGGPN